MATGDEFFTPDDTYAWFEGMKDNTWLRLLPNSEHGMSLHSLSSQNIRKGFTICPIGRLNFEKFQNFQA